MRIVVDMQGAQSTGNRNRGIGRYTLNIIKAIVKYRGNHEIILALNGQFLETIKPIRTAFDGILPQENIRVWYTPAQVSYLDRSNEWLRNSAELLRESFLASFDPDVVLISSLFEGLGDDAVTSIGKLSNTIPVAVILYDLIPYIYPNTYLEDPLVSSWYMSKLEQLRHADLLLAISESSRQEAISYLDSPEERAINISSAVNDHFKPRSYNSVEANKLLTRYGLSRPFLMYTGGIDYRKNIEGLIKAYSELDHSVRKEHQLAVVCSMKQADREHLNKLVKNYGLSPDEVVFTGFVPEEDLIALYNLCKVFVFPSLHEGFGLPALEAMSCGKAVIASNTSSLPEVVGRVDALFDPYNIKDITRTMQKVLTDDDFRRDLEEHSLDQAKKFSWDKTAKTAIAAIESMLEQRNKTKAIIKTRSNRPKLAYISPLPPERSGISDYSAELLPELSRYYDIDVIVDQDEVSDPWIENNCAVRSVNWFKEHSGDYDRIMYHFGNSVFHHHMFKLLEEIPGVVVLHDFFLSGILSHMDLLGYLPNGFVKEIYFSHGYKAVQEYFETTDRSDIIYKYPCNLSVLQNALGIIVHSEYSKKLAQYWYGEGAVKNWAVIPLVRGQASQMDRLKARRSLQIKEDSFVVCSFGLLGETKLNHKLLEAWIDSSLATNKNCLLIFAGENNKDEYGLKMQKAIHSSGVSERIRITGWLDINVYRQFLAAADIAVQLRTLSRGETSAAVLDCMNYGLPTIINAHGSMAELPDEAVFKLPDEFSLTQLKEALEILWQDESLRQRLGKQAQEFIHTKHAPNKCAKMYYQAIETIYRRGSNGIHALINRIAELKCLPADKSQRKYLASCIARSLPPNIVVHQLLVDISELVKRDIKTGIQRVVRSILHEWLHNPPVGWRVEPVYATEEKGYRYARKFTASFLNFPSDILADDLVEYNTGDVFIGLDLNQKIVSAHKNFYQQMRSDGVKVYFMVYDLLPITLPKAFPSEMIGIHEEWLKTVVENDGAICISKSVADELAAWMQTKGISLQSPFKISWVHLGADMENSLPTSGLPDNANNVIKAIYSRPSFLMVGTLEPRKGHSQVLAAFERLWNKGMNINLVIVGKRGWMTEKLVETISKHYELNKRLFWLDGASDEYLEILYDACTCLINASEGEGFGLPIIEAAKHNLPIISRDIPVFREVAGEHAYYFNGLEPEAVEKCIKDWLSLYEKGKHPVSKNINWLTWKETAQQLLEKIGVIK
ncbi:MAG: glycosyltransferase [Tissierellia bacterium]|nr:glycosyltransferase [Tissierellia bacterium]